MGIAYGLAQKELQDVEKNTGMIVLREKIKIEIIKNLFKNQ
jgi:hypothetical protein